MLPEEVKGEYVLITDGGTEETKELSEEELENRFEELKKTMKSNDALKALAQETGMNKRELYDMFMKK